MSNKCSRANTRKLLDIIARVAQSNCTAPELSESVGRTESALSPVLRELRQAGLVYVIGTKRLKRLGYPLRVYAWNPKPHLCQDCFEPLEQGE